MKLDDTETSEVEEERPEHDLWDSNYHATDDSSLDLFFASVCQSTKRLPRNLQSTVKRQVLDVLLRVEEEWEQVQTDSKAELNKEFD